MRRPVDQHVLRGGGERRPHVSGDHPEEGEHEDGKADRRQIAPQMPHRPDSTHVVIGAGPVTLAEAGCRGHTASVWAKEAE
ncbi:hypothetical protein Misp03_39070 [Microbispora sp. NBRC 16548]|nr:hypothetical protein Misp03_39070 [Microbispora sp. NBRC 16548]